MQDLFRLNACDQNIYSILCRIKSTIHGLYVIHKASNTDYADDFITRLSSAIKYSFVSFKHYPKCEILFNTLHENITPLRILAGIQPEATYTDKEMNSIIEGQYEYLNPLEVLLSGYECPEHVNSIYKYCEDYIDMYNKNTSVFDSVLFNIFLDSVFNMPLKN